MQALADESEYVRDTGLRAGQKIINMFAETSIELVLPEVCITIYVYRASLIYYYICHVLILIRSLYIVSYTMCIFITCISSWRMDYLMRTGELD